MDLTKKVFSRRALLGGFALLGAGSLLPACTDIISTPGMAAYQGPGLRQLADNRSYHFGTAVSSRAIDSAFYTNAIIKHCNLLVPENELKWRVIQPQPDVFDFSRYDKIAAFAAAHNMKVRGHTLVWHTRMPDWAYDVLETGTRRDATELMTTHITKALQHTAGQINDWDVVNEAVDPHSTRSDFLRENSLWMKALGPDYLALAYRTARQINPRLTLTYNDYSVEYADGAGIRRRAGVLALLRRLRDKNIPVHQLGLQSHLSCSRPLGGKAFTDFLQQVRALGVKVVVTELDLKLEKLPGTDAERLAAGAHYAGEYLKMLQDGGSLDTVLTWGLSSPYSFMVQKDRTALDPLPLDEGMNPLPLWYALRDDWLSKKT